MESRLEKIEAHYKEIEAYAATSSHRYPECPYEDDHGAGCDCARSTMLGLEVMGISHDVAVSIASIEQALQIRQYGFDGHDDSFDDFNTKFVEMDLDAYPGDEFMAPIYTKWVAENQPAVQWALDFSDLRQYL